MHKKNELYKDAALKIARGLCRDAIWYNNTCNWISAYVDPDDDRQLYTRSCNENLYEGVAGIAFFLMQIAAVSDDKVLRKTARGALQQLGTNHQLSTQLGNIGFYTGLTGLAYVMKKAGDIFDEELYDDFSRQWVKEILQVDPVNCKTDAVDGIAGALPVLINLYKYFNDKTLHDYIHSLADCLLLKKNEHEAGWSWTTLPETNADLTGFGHGAAGIGHAFTCMYQFSAEKKYAEAVSKAFAYENYHFQKKQMNWPDLRNRITGTDDSICSLAWCHGAPGIGMARLYAWEVFGKQDFYDDAMVAIGTTKKYSTIEALRNLSLCHGLAGNAELILLASDIIQEGELENEARIAADKITMDYVLKRIPLPGGAGYNKETPGLMTGSSGVGYFLLRMFDPVRFPSVLLPGANW